MTNGEPWTTSYRQIHRPTARGIARGAAVGGLAFAAELSGRIARALARPRVHFVYLHHVFDDEVAKFRALVADLIERMTPLSYGDAVARCVAGPIDRPYVAFSFDDGFHNCLEAADVLDALGVKACFFVCPGIVDERDGQRLAQISRERFHLPPMRFMDWDDLDALRGRGHAIGNHTRSHVDLAAVGDAARDEVERAAEMLRVRCGGPTHFAWPYGRLSAITPAARAIVEASGHASCASGVRGAHVTPAGDVRRLCIRRDHVVAAWPLRHVRYLLARSAARATAADNEWPPDLETR